MPSEQAVESIEKPLRELRNQFVTLTAPHRTPLWNYCLKLTGSPWDAEDLVQETMMKTFARLALLGQAVNVKAYLFRIASNTWIDQLRRTKMIAEELDVAMEAAREQPAGRTTETREAIEILVSILPPRQRIIYLLIEVFDFKFCPELIEYAAHLLGVPAKTWGYTFDSLPQSESS